jgi:hypothetical protein
MMEDGFLEEFGDVGLVAPVLSAILILPLSASVFDLDVAFGSAAGK